MKFNIIFVSLGVVLLFSSCSELSSITGSARTKTDGGDVPSTIQFQNYRFRTGSAFKATQLGAVGLKRSAGPNVFEIKTIPKLSNLALVRSASFTKSTSSEFEMIGNLSLQEVKALNANFDGKISNRTAESGIFTIYHVANTRDLVTQLNSPKNSGLLEYFKRSKDFRIITAIVKVHSHSFLATKEKEINYKVLSALQQEGTAVANTKEEEGAEAQVVNIKDEDTAGDSLPKGLRISDGGTYGYEFSRVIWDINSGKVVDLLADRPGRWYSWSDSKDHEFLGATNDPRKIARLRR